MVIGVFWHARTRAGKFACASVMEYVDVMPDIRSTVFLGRQSFQRRQGKGGGQSRVLLWFLFKRSGSWFALKACSSFYQTISNFRSTAARALWSAK
jgi:hypothetical protein